MITTIGSIILNLMFAVCHVAASALSVSCQMVRLCQKVGFHLLTSRSFITPVRVNLSARNPSFFFSLFLPGRKQLRGWRKTDWCPSGVACHLTFTPLSSPNRSTQGVRRFMSDFFVSWGRPWNVQLKINRNQPLGYSIFKFLSNSRVRIFILSFTVPTIFFKKISSFRRNSCNLFQI